MKTTELSPTGPASFGVIAERFRRAGQAEKAVSLCREGLDKFPDHLSARVTLGWSLLDLGEHQEAFDQLKSVLKRAPDNLAAIRGLAELHERGIGLVFDSLSEPETEPETLALDEDIDPVEDIDPGEDIDPVLPEPVVTAMSGRDEFGDLDPIVAPQFAIEDVIDAVEPDGMFDMSGIFDAGPPAPPVSLFARAPLALRDDADAERVDELNDWLSRLRDRRSESVSQSMAS